MSSSRLRLPNLDELEPKGPRSCTCRVYTCCCCVPLGPGAIVIAVLCFLEAIVAYLIKDWINLFLQGLLLCLFIVALIKRFNKDVRRCLFLAYTLVMVLNLIELIAFIVVYLVIFDLIGEQCEDYQVNPPSDDRLIFETVEACEYNLRLAIIAALVAGSLLYFPLKYHFTLVLRAYYKEKRDARQMLIQQEEEQAQTARTHIQMTAPPIDRQKTGTGLITPGITPWNEGGQPGTRNPSIEPDQNTEGTIELESDVKSKSVSSFPAREDYRPEAITIRAEEGNNQLPHMQNRNANKGEFEDVIRGSARY